MEGEHENNNNNNNQEEVAQNDQQIINKPASPRKNKSTIISQPDDDEEQQQQSPCCTPEKVQKIPKDDSFKTCKASMPTPATRRQLRATPARNSILSGGKPYKEITTSGRKFNSRRKRNSKLNGGVGATCTSGDRLNESADSNETFIRHERELAYDPDSLDPEVSTRRLPLDIDDGINRPDISHLSLTPTKQQQLSPIMKPDQQRKEELKQQQPKQQPTPQRSSKRMSKQMQQKPKPLAMPTSTPMPFAIPKAKSKPKPNPFYFNRYMSSTAKKPQQQKQQQQHQQQQSSIFKKPSSVISNFSVASSRRCLSQWNTPRITRTQSFKSTAELEREYFSSLRSRL